MKIVKIVGTVLIAIIVVIGFNKDNTNIQKTINTVSEEFKQVQDDKDSVVETNKQILEEQSQRKKEIAEIKNAVNVMALEQRKAKEKNNFLEDKMQQFIQALSGEKPVKQTEADADHQAAENTDNQTNNIINPANALVNGLDNRVNFKQLNQDEILNSAYTNNGYVWIKPIAVAVTKTFVEHTNKAIVKGVVTDNQILVKKDIKTKDVNEAEPRYTIPTNSVLSAKLITGLLGRIPAGGQVTDPFRFLIRIEDRAFFANYQQNEVIQGAFMSGVAKGDLLLSCVKAEVDSISFIFSDGTISEVNSTGALGYLTDEYGYPCIKGELKTNAPTYLTSISAFNAITAAAKAFAQKEQTINTNKDGNTTSSVTGSPESFAAYSALAGGVDQANQWVIDRAKSSFDVIATPAGQKVKFFSSQQIKIDYLPKGRMLNHQAKTNSTREQSYVLD